MSDEVPAQPAKSGSLTILGSGIASIVHFTLQAVSHIEQADKVFYTLADSVTEIYIRSKNKNCVDLFSYYGNGKDRMETYVQMSEVMLDEVRAGQNVVGVFYGHPGVLVTSSQRAIAIAKDEGYPAKMLPGISAVDTLWADLGVDPSRSGCVLYEATDLLLRTRPLLTSSDVIIFQVGFVGVIDFNTSKDATKSGFSVLVDRIAQAYGEDHPVVHYIAAVMPMTEPVMVKFAVKDLRKPEVAETFNGYSTFYIPAKEQLPVNEQIASHLGLLTPSSTAATKAITPGGVYPANKWALNAPAAKPYSESDLTAVAALKKQGAMDDFDLLKASPAMKILMVDLALDPKLLKKYVDDPESVIASVEDLRDDEKAALISRDPNQIQCTMKPSVFPENVLSASRVPLNTVAPLDTVAPLNSVAPNSVAPLNSVVPNFVAPLNSVVPNFVAPLNRVAPNFVAPLNSVIPNFVAPLNSVAPLKSLAPLNSMAALNAVAPSIPVAPPNPAAPLYTVDRSIYAVDPRNAGAPLRSAASFHPVAPSIPVAPLIPVASHNPAAPLIPMASYNPAAPLIPVASHNPVASPYTIDPIYAVDPRDIAAPPNNMPPLNSMAALNPVAPSIPEAAFQPVGASLPVAPQTYFTTLR